MNIIFNGTPREMPDHISVAQLLEQLELQPRQVAVEVNLDVVPRTCHKSHVLHEGDRVEVVTLVGGG